MVHIFYTKSDKKLSAPTWSFWLNQLTPAMQQQISRFKHWQDAQRSLLGKALLMTGCTRLHYNNTSMANIQISGFQKPYFADGPFFNISHSGNVVVCAICSTHEIGIDVEEVKPIPVSDFSDLFSEEEQKLFTVDEKDYYPFYNLWTQKEAFVKAYGTGLSLPLRQLDVNDDRIYFEGSPWFITRLDLDPGYACHLVTGFEKIECVVGQVVFD